MFFIIEISLKINRDVVEPFQFRFISAFGVNSALESVRGSELLDDQRDLDRFPGFDFPGIEIFGLSDLLAPGRQTVASTSTFERAPESVAVQNDLAPVLILVVVREEPRILFVVFAANRVFDDDDAFVLRVQFQPVPNLVLAAIVSQRDVDDFSFGAADLCIKDCY